MLPHIAARAFNAPLLVEPRKAVAFAHGLGARVLGQPMAFLDDDEDDVPAAKRPLASLLGNELAEWVEPGYGYGLVDGVAIVPIAGVLVHRGAWVGKSSGQTSYEGIRAQLDAAADNPAVRAIALEIDSFGGEVAGCFGLADRVREIGALKPVRAFIAEHAFSAAYALASQAGEIVVPRTGGLGSIGVLCMHVDMSRALDTAGLGVTLIHAGKHKVDGNPYAPLPEAVRADFEAEMESLRQLFAWTVAAGRGDRLSADAALATEARCLTGADAVAAGLADAVGEPREAFLEFVAEMNGGGSTFNGGQILMTKQTAAKLSAEPEDPKTPEEEAASTEDETGGEEETTPPPAEDEGDGGVEEDEPAEATARNSERKRIAAILTSEAAAGREDLARHLALETDMAPKAAIAALEKAAVGGATTGRLAQAMRAQGGVPSPAVPGASGARERVSAAERMRASAAGR
ncbi:S49 family peptidase [Amaricoccus solimangrovi]|uniref:S49 family peptidase n=1 Tax=Amaricoccus solimangrovi TaxID=2589815 RepID=UPI0015E3398C|nr:S49 family peptidase [Amaricoccus solimangrovi]